MNIARGYRTFVDALKGVRAVYRIIQMHRAHDALHRALAECFAAHRSQSARRIVRANQRLSQANTRLSMRMMRTWEHAS